MMAATQWVLVTFFWLWAAGCTVANRLVEPATDLRFEAGPAINPDMAGRPSPVVIRVYELSAADRFERSDFFQLFDTPEQALGPQLLAQSELQLRPGAQVEHILQLQKETRYLGVVAAYRDIERARWRLVIKADPRAYRDIEVELGELAMRRAR